MVEDVIHIAFTLWNAGKTQEALDADVVNSRKACILLRNNGYRKIGLTPYTTPISCGYVVLFEKEKDPDA